MKKILRIFGISLLILVVYFNTNQYNKGGTTLTGIQFPNTNIETGGIPNNSGGNNDTSQEYMVNLAEINHSLSFLLNTGENITLLVEQPNVKAAIRVSQIIMPDGTMDGPFGSELTFTSKQKGIYKFIISVNQMASEEIFTGSVMIKTERTHNYIK